MKSLLIFPPQMLPISPFISVPLLVGQLKANGFSAEGWDLNADFYNDVLKKEYLVSAVEKSKLILEKLSDEISKQRYTEVIESDLPIEIKTLKQTTIKNFLSNEKIINDCINNIEDAVSCMKSPKKFYNNKVFIRSNKIISNALKLVFLPYAPSRLDSAYNFCNPLFKHNFEDIDFQANNPDINIHIDYFREKLKGVNLLNYNLIGISIKCLSQMVPAFTLAKMIKQQTNAHISIGGNLISRISDDLIKHEEIFNSYFDSILWGDGENSIIELAKYIDGKENKKNVSGLIYKENEQIVSNKYKDLTDMNNIANIDLDDFDLSKYLTPEIVMPLQIFKGCEWRKCTFCSISYGKSTYVQKSPEKIVSEIKEIGQKYGINHFEFIDESLPPDYLDKFSDLLKKEKLNIYYYGNVRLDDKFSLKLLKKLRKTGLRMLQWGYESASERIMKLINKGIDLNKRIPIIKRSSDAGIWNHIFFIYGFPTETLDEMEETLKILNDNSKIIHSHVFHKFRLKQNSIIFNQKNIIDTRKIIKKQEFMPDYYYEEANSDDIGLIKNKISKFLIKDKKLPLWSLLMPDEYLLLYLAKFNKDKIKHSKIKII